MVRRARWLALGMVLVLMVALPEAASARRPAAAAAPRAFPATTAGIAVFADQLPSSMTEAQYRFAAAHYVGTQKMVRRDADHLRRYNPAMVILHYRLPIGESDASVQIVDGNAWISDYAAVNPHEDWFYHVGHAREFMSQWHWYLMNPDSGWRDYWLRRVRRELADNGADAVFADSLSVPNYFGGSAWSPPLPDYDPRFEAAWSARIDRFLAYVRPRLDGAKLIPNAGAWVTTRDATDYSLADGVMIEGFAEWAPGHPFAIGDWQLQMNRILSLERKHRIVIAQNYLDSAADVATRRFYLSTYLLVRGDHTYVNYVAGGQTLSWYPEWNTPIGAPTGALAASISGFYDAASGLYRRAYSNGLVIVNPGTARGTLALGRAYYLVTPVGGGAVPDDANVACWRLTYRPVTRITVAPNDAAILVRTPPQA